MKKLLLLLSLVVVACTFENTSDVYYTALPSRPMEACEFDDTVDVETETPIPEYAFSLEYPECEESIALFRENLIFSGVATIALTTDVVTETVVFTNSMAMVSYDDQDFTILTKYNDMDVVLGSGNITNNVARIETYAPIDASFYYRSFDENGWISAYAEEQDGFCAVGSNTISFDRPPLNEISPDNDSGWGNDVELNFIFDPSTGAYEGCINGVDDYTIEWRINDNVYFGDTIEVIVGKPLGVYFISATVYHNSERMTLSHDVLKTIAGKVVRRARIRRPSSGG